MSMPELEAGTEAEASDGICLLAHAPDLLSYLS